MFLEYKPTGIITSVLLEQFENYIVKDVLDCNFISGTKEEKTAFNKALKNKQLLNANDDDLTKFLIEKE